MRSTLLFAIVCSGPVAALLIHSALAAAAATPPATPNVINLDHCVVQLNEIDGEALVPAQEAGTLMKILVRDGQQVRAGELLANIDDNQVRAAKEKRQAALQRRKRRREQRHRYSSRGKSR